MKILFIGCVQSSEILLRKLIDLKSNIIGVITKEASNINSDFKDLRTLCQENAIEYRYVNNINDIEVIEYIKRKSPDIIYCFGWSQLIKEEVISIPKKGIVGFHPAELPYNRGRHPIVWALALGLQHTASTFFMMDKGTDTGDILSQIKVKIDYEDDAADLYQKIMEVAKKQVESITYKISTNSQELIKQTNQDVNSWRKRNKRDGEIDWRMSSYNIYNLIRALTKPYVGAHFAYKGNDIKVWKAKEIKTKEFRNIEPGKVIEVYSKTAFLVKAGENLLHVIKCDEIDLKEGEYIL